MNPYTQGQAMPGMEFFKSLLKGSGMPTGFASWMAPTMDPQELEQKITDLKAVLQWLEANARLTQATIQTLEVQRMTLSALKTMNVDLGDLASRMTEAMQAGAQAMGAAATAASGQQNNKAESAAAFASERSRGESASRPWGAHEQAQEPEPDAEAEAAGATEQVAAGGDAAASSSAASPLPGVMDPMQWWNAVSQQFSQVATQALRENPWPMPPGVAAAETSSPVAAAFAQTSAGMPKTPKAPETPKAAARRAAATTPAAVRRKPTSSTARAASGKAPRK
jgi:hypothetical protein